MKKKLKKNNTKLPVKRTINLVEVSEEKFNVKLAVPLVLLVLAAAALFSKFAVLDRLTAVSRAEAEVASLQSRLDSMYAELKNNNELEDEYAHYTYTGLTDAERSLTKRSAVIELLKQVLNAEASTGSWSITGNTLTLDVVGNSLQEINMLASTLREEPIVDFCTVTNAVMSEYKEMNGLLIYLNAPDGGAQTEEPMTAAELAPGESGEDAEPGEDAESGEDRDTDENEQPAVESAIESAGDLATRRLVKANIIVYLRNSVEDDSQ